MSSNNRALSPLRGFTVPGLQCTTCHTELIVNTIYILIVLTVLFHVGHEVPLGCRFKREEIIDVLLSSELKADFRGVYSLKARALQWPLLWVPSTSDLTQRVILACIEQKQWIILFY